MSKRTSAKKPSPREILVAFKVNEAEKAKLQAAADAEHLSLSAFVRQKALNAAEAIKG